jgi:tripartite-type tricarboxylate transporter receptor subunit TctC
MKPSPHPLPGLPRRLALRPVLAALLTFAAALPASAAPDASFPTKPVRIVVAFAPGGPNDLMARVLAGRLSANTGQQFLVDNKAGAGGTIGSDAVAKAEPDGYTLLFVSAPFVIAPSLYGKKLQYDTLKDFTAISKVAESPLVLMTAPASPYKSLREVLDAAKARPDKLNYGSGGVASTPHLAVSLLQATTGTRMTHIPYKGGGPSIQALMGGEVDVLLDSITTGGTFVASGKLRALAVTSATRSPKLPDVPTFAEAGLPDYKMTHWVGLVAPAKTPAAVLEKLHNETVRALAADDVKARYTEMGAQAVPTSAADFNAFIKAEVERWAQVVRSQNIQPE